MAHSMNKYFKHINVKNNPTEYRGLLIWWTVDYLNTLEISVKYSPVLYII